MKKKELKKRGAKPIKQYDLKRGELSEFEISEQYNIRYRARAENWKVSIKKIGNKLFVFRSI